ncbi:protein of unknown function [Streptomyces murinus]
MITHRNLLANMRLISGCADGGPDSRAFCWLPVIHDMGLIGQVLWMLFLGGCTTLTSPTEFLRRPYRWLQLLDELNADFSVAPNFAYDLCVRTVSEDKVPGLDLSRWRVTFNGAEPVQARSWPSSRRSSGGGFRAEAFLPCYGLAEATLLVTGTAADSAPVITTVDAEALARGSSSPWPPGTVRASWSAVARWTGPGCGSWTPGLVPRCRTPGSARSGCAARASPRGTGAAPT